MTCFRLLPTRWKRYRRKGNSGEVWEHLEGGGAQQRGTAAPRQKLLARGSNGTPHREHPSLPSREKQQCEELAELSLARAMAGERDGQQPGQEGAQCSEEQPGRSPGELLVWRKSAGRGRRGEQGHPTARLAQLPGEMLPAPRYARAARTPTSVSHRAASLR